jgi:hypothetical protein
MNRRIATIVVCVIDAVVWAIVAFAAFFSGSDPATRGLDQAAGWVVTALLLITAVPASILVSMRRAPITALILALAFPAAFALAFVAAVVAFA